MLLKKRHLSGVYSYIPTFSYTVLLYRYRKPGYFPERKRAEDPYLCYQEV